MSLVSVVVPTRGGAARLPVLIDALRRQSHPEWEAIVVVDGDIDDSAGVLQRLAGDLPVRTIVFAENRGRSAALNAGFEAARGDVLVRCDDDLAPRPEHLARHLAHHTAAPTPIGLIGLCPNVYPRDTPYAQAYGRHRDRLLRSAAYAAAAEDTWRYWAANVSVTADTWHRIGPYDTRLRAYGWEDVDWGYRVHRAGLPVRIAPDLEAEHHGAADTTGARALRAYYSGAARHAFVGLHPDDPDLPRLVPAAAAGPGAWGRAVGVVSRVTSERRLGVAGRWLDRILPVVPSRIGEKLVSLTVESAAVAGYRSGTTKGMI